jgi:tetratricopeptide (TPR) repeat protein
MLLFDSFTACKAFRRSLATALVCATWLGVAVTTVAQAQEAPYHTVQRLLNAGQTTEAMTTADAWLAEHERDAQMRFLKGVIQSQQGHTDAALATFTALTRDFPELPEPHNNLAVLHANAQRYDEARAALETAIRLNPSYARAYQNLGDLYVKLAAQAYGRSLELDANNAGLRPRVQTLNQLLSTPASTR